MLLQYKVVPVFRKGRGELEDTTLAPYFAYLEKGVLAENETVARELALTKSQFQVGDGVLHHVEKDKTLSHPSATE